jgi:polysaccharide deacetylase family protein (PEP-CTERM system associated)
VGQFIPPTREAVNHFYETLRFLDKIGTKATLFFQGELAYHYPEIVKEGWKSGHEIASHGYNHIPLWEMTPEEFKNDLALSLKVLEDIVGQKVKGYRAPRFSLTPTTQWAWEIMADIGIEYSSSVSPLRFPSIESPVRVANGKLLELPISCITILGKKWNVSGGRMLRFLPIRVIASFFGELNEKCKPFVLYLHTYELANSLKPRLRNLSLTAKGKIFLYFSLYNFLLGRIPHCISELSRRFSFAPITDLLRDLKNIASNESINSKF